MRCRALFFYFSFNIPLLFNTRLLLPSLTPTINALRICPMYVICIYQWKRAPPSPCSLTSWLNTSHINPAILHAPWLLHLFYVASLSMRRG
ncbi:hypothetical protein BC939DRAFT_436083 [Gamsiella multidivaricata]|uniref:uncharacterized protein n=1 Tax=Gamsiella multidivaricata TaxID=101098 RepID=UPI002220379A|nr:uncharacterized protein BC939DRAFT_436083 [Gamsiella multidivaricata]KAI7831699.1 hypothetical protein BC939DRAFT_436083 [Gamsiella multidivaricata]